MIVGRNRADCVSATARGRGDAGRSTGS